MAVKTKFSNADFSEILSHYDLGSFKKAIPFKMGAVQTNLLLETSKGKFVLRYYENRAEQYAIFEANLLLYLSKHSYPCPSPIRKLSGDFVGIFNKKPFVILEFIQGKYIPNPDNHKKIANAIGRLHGLTRKYKPKYYEVRDSYDSKSALRNATSNSRQIASKTEARQRLVWLKSELKKLRLPSNLPKGVCHCDTHPSNFLYDKHEEVVAVLDFDDTSYVPFLYDVANLIYFWAWSSDGRIDFRKTKEILTEYSKYRKLTPLEKRHLFDLLKMVIFMSIGWFIHVDTDYFGEKKKIEALDAIGRVNFYDLLFD